MSIVRIYVPTLRRHRLLRRALDSLLAQTRTDWIAEIHNDDPTDDFPRLLVQELAEPRLLYVHHSQNLGACDTFNLFFQPVAEPYISILEDDNAWEPLFLETMLQTAETRTDVDAFWSNMRIWREQADGSLEDTGDTVWPIDPGQPIREFTWGQPQQTIGALHSNGAMLLRSASTPPLVLPGVPFAFIEPFRERAFGHPIILVNRPLAHFTLTVQTARSDSPTEHAELQTLLAATFLQQAQRQEGKLKEIWEWATAQKPPCSAPLLLAAFFTPAAFFFWRRESPLRLARLLVTLFLRPSLLWRLARSRSAHRDWWDFLNQHTSRRFAATRP